MDGVARAAIERVEQAGIIFLDEIDKIAGREGAHGPDVSREGVQRDILPSSKARPSTRSTAWCRTDHILFIAAGAFHVSKPSDLIPELQGRFPIRVELEALGRDEFVRILTEPRNALIKQYMALMATEGVTLEFTPDADRAHRGAGDARQRAHREHRRAAPAHRAGAAARRGLVSRARARRPDRLRSTRPTWTACSPTSPRATTCRGTSCERRAARGSPRWSRSLVAAVGRLRQEAARRCRRCGRCPARVSGLSTASAIGDRVDAALHGAGRQPRRHRRRRRSTRIEIFALTHRGRCAAPRRPTAAERGRAGRIAVHARCDGAPNAGRSAPARRPTPRPTPGDVASIVDRPTLRRSPRPQRPLDALLRGRAAAGTARPAGSVRRRFCRVPLARCAGPPPDRSARLRRDRR